jgi:hypothetical protein
MQVLEDFFLYVYVIEMVIKISALGFILPENAYLKDNWNALDFLIVFVSILSQIFGLQDMKALRTLRVLRPLRSISRVKSLRLMLNALFSSFGMLKDNLIILFFYITVFAIIGLLSF